MILGDLTETGPASGGRTRLEDMLRRGVARYPNAIAVADPPNRASFTDGAPRNLTFVEIDCAVSAIAGRLRQLGLQTDAVVAFQLPNTVESILLLLGILRAGMIAVPLPMLWRKAELVPALNAVGAKMLITTRRIGTTAYCDLAMQVAADVFSIRYVGSFGLELPDGVIPLDDVFEGDSLDPIPTVERPGNPAAHVAAITFEVTPEGLVPLARSHGELIAGGIAVCLELRSKPNPGLLSALPVSSFAGISLTLMPWLLDGGPLALHQPFYPASFSRQQRELRCRNIVLPGPLIGLLSECGLIAPDAGIRNIIALWRAPERLNASPDWRGEPGMLDVLSFGEVGLLAARRLHDGQPAPIYFGPVGVSQRSQNAPAVAEVARTENGMLAFRGPMVPAHPFPPGVEATNAPQIKSDRGFLSTGYACRTEDRLMVTASPPGLASIGGYRFALRKLQDTMASLAPQATFAAFPDALSGHRFAGSASNPMLILGKLAEAGLNPLIADAFRPRERAA